MKSVDFTISVFKPPIQRNPPPPQTSALCVAGPHGAEEGGAGAGVPGSLGPPGISAEVAAGDARDRSPVLQHQETERGAAAAAGQGGGEDTTTT